jgi:hypothetical protein
LQSKLTPADTIRRLVRKTVAWRSGCDGCIVAVLIRGCWEGGEFEGVEKGQGKPI